MTQTRAEKLARLNRRKSASYKGPIKGLTAPGSLNDRKSSPKGVGRRTSEKVHADSRNASAS